jgi:hypothetical protein
MKTLADEIHGILSTKAVPLSVIVARLGADAANVRRAAQALNDSGKALLVRRRRVLHLASTAYTVPVCKNCYGEFERPIFACGKASKRLTCSPFCHAAWGWKSKPGARERKIAGIKKQRATPEAKAILAAHNKRRWSKPEEHERLSEQNRREWADPEKKAKRAAGIRAAHGSAEKRKFYSDMRKADWQKPGYRERAIASMREVKNRPEVKAAFARLIKARWKDPKLRPKFLASAKRNGQKAIERLKGKEQTPEQIRKRVESRKRTMAARRAETTGTAT